MTAIKVREPGSRRSRLLHILPVRNFCYPGWVVFIPGQKNILLYLENGTWRMTPEKISYTFAEEIGKKIRQLELQ